jgi:hypothetical protein
MGEIAIPSYCHSFGKYFGFEMPLWRLHKCTIDLQLFLAKV